MATGKSAFKCPICRNAFPNRIKLEAHVPDCSVNDAINQIAQQNIPNVQKLKVIADLGNIARAFTFAHKFDDATEAERSAMYVCTECYTSEQNHMPAPLCGACGRGGTMMLASVFVDTLLADEDTSKHLLN